VDLDSVEQVDVVISDEEKARRARFDARPLLSNVLNLHDFEVGIFFSDDLSS
jgi:L-lactate dehydrogenase (cytochrome)